MNNLFIISKYTFLDQMRHKSFFMLLGISVLFVFFLRNCYNADYTVNGAKVDNLKVAWHASTVAFHIIAAGMFLIASMLSIIPPISGGASTVFTIYSTLLGF